jgi:predicted acetyltransferase
MTFRRATLDDCALLAELNHQLIRDEGHRNRMTIPELEQRLRAWLASEYAAVLFMHNRRLVAYALYREQPEEIYLRHLFVVRDQRRRGFGRRAVEMLRQKVWPQPRRLTVEVLLQNQDALAFWRAVGYVEYSVKLESLPATQA